MGRWSEERRGFSITELIVVVGTVSVLMALLLPGLHRARRQVRSLVSASNQRQIVNTLCLYAGDHDGFYPPSVATLRFTDNTWYWQEPRMMIACQPRTERSYRSMASYLGAYLDDSRILQCPCAPRKNIHLTDAWTMGEAWENPETGFTDDPLFGTYCFLWNYVGYSEIRAGPLRGPSRMADRPGQGRVLVCDYMGYGHHLRQEAFGSCQPFAGADIVRGTEVSADYWAGTKQPNPRLHAGYTDGHVSSFQLEESHPMDVAETRDGRSPCARGMVGAGVFYLPGDILH